MNRNDRSRSLHQRADRRKPCRIGGRESGVAMLLVLVCLATATIATTAYIASRDNSAVIGKNVADAAAAQWAASSGLGAAIAALETSWDWRSMHVNGQLFANVPIAGATVSVSVADLQTNLPPTETTSYIRLMATARVGHAEQTAESILHVPGLLDEALVIDLSEFAIFYSGSLELRDRAVLARWPKSPIAIVGSRVPIGGTATASSSIIVREDAAAIDATVFSSPTRSAALISHDSGPELQEIVLPDPLPFPDPPQLLGLSPTVIPAPPNYMLPSGTFLINESSRYGSMELKNAAEMTLRGHITVVLENDLLINSNARMLVDGNVKLVVFGNLLMDTGGIELTQGSTLTAFVRGTATASWSVDLRNAYIGDAASAGVRDASGEAAWSDPQSVTFYSIENLLNTPKWRLRGNTVVKGGLYAPQAAELRLEETSAVYGRVAAKDVRVGGDSAIFFCPSLQPYNGFTNLSGALYDDDGRLRAEFKLLSSLDALVLEPIASTSRNVIRMGKQLIGDAEDLVSSTDNTVTSVSTTVGGTVARLERRLR